MGSYAHALRWLVLGLALAALLESFDHSSLLALTSLDESQSLALPARVSFIGLVSNVRFSGTALVFDVMNGHTLPCYFRHPPRELFVFAGESYSIRARLESTPTGMLCVVEEMRSHGSA